MLRSVSPKPRTMIPSSMTLRRSVWSSSNSIRSGNSISLNTDKRELTPVNENPVEEERCKSIVKRFERFDLRTPLLQRQSSEPRLLPSFPNIQEKQNGVTPLMLDLQALRL